MAFEIVDGVLEKYREEPGVTEVTVPEGVKSIDHFAFSDCTSLVQITLPGGVTKIGWYAFVDCTNLAQITLPEGVTSIGERAFKNCESLTQITLPEGVTKIDKESFYGCTRLTRITLPESLKSIGENAFWGCESLTQITLPEGLQIIVGDAFRNCKSLTQITLPEGVTSIGKDAFEGCKSLHIIKLRPGDPAISIDYHRVGEKVGRLGRNIHKALTMLHSGDYAVKFHSGLKYPVLILHYLHTRDEALGAYIRENITEIMNIAVTNDVLPFIRAITQDDAIITKENIDGFILQAQNEKSIRLRLFSWTTKTGTSALMMTAACCKTKSPFSLRKGGFSCTHCLAFRQKICYNRKNNSQEAIYMDRPKLTYDIADKPAPAQLAVLAFQQMLAILAATIAVPMIIGNGLTPAAAMFGAGVGTIVYLLFTKRKSPVFLGSSFAFLGSMSAAFAGAASAALGMLGLLLGAALAGLVYVLIALIIKKTGVEWLNKLMPPVVIGPTVAIIGLSLAGNAVSDLQHGDVFTDVSPLPAILCGLVTLGTVMFCSAYGQKYMKLFPFVLGILAGYLCALLLTVIGGAAGIPGIQLIDLSVFGAYMLPEGHLTVQSFISLPHFTFMDAFSAFGDFSGSYFATIFAAYVPVAFVVFAEHVADHKNLSSITGRDLLTDPGLSNTLLGDGIGSMAGAFFGGCPNTTYGESIACVAITGNASTLTIFTAAIGCMLFSFITPLVAFVDSIPACVMGGVCIALYGFIAVSGLKMLQQVDLNISRNLFTASVILITGIGGLSLHFGAVTITEIAAALILGILTNTLLAKAKN